MRDGFSNQPASRRRHRGARGYTRSGKIRIYRVATRPAGSLLKVLDKRILLGSTGVARSGKGRELRQRGLARKIFENLNGFGSPKAGLRRAVAWQGRVEFVGPNCWIAANCRTARRVRELRKFAPSVRENTVNFDFSDREPHFRRCGPTNHPAGRLPASGSSRRPRLLDFLMGGWHRIDREITSAVFLPSPCPLPNGDRKSVV